MFAIAGTLLAVAGAIASLRADPSTINAGFAGGSVLAAFVSGSLDIAFRGVGLWALPVDAVNVYRECLS